jgi:hypothetical protein
MIELEKPATKWFSVGGEAFSKLHLTSAIKANDDIPCPECSGTVAEGCVDCDYEGKVRHTGNAVIEIDDAQKRARIELGDQTLDVPLQTFDFWVHQRAKMLGYREV